MVFADDQFVNQQFMQIIFQDLELESTLTIFSNGIETVNYFKRLLESKGSSENQ